jgi:rsbT co-antagonist protein RsbR
VSIWGSPFEKASSDPTAQEAMTSPQAASLLTEIKAPAESASTEASEPSVVIAELKVELAALRARHHLLISVIDNSPSFIFTKDVESRYTFVNRRIEGLFGLPQDQIVGKLDDAFFSPETAATVLVTDREIMAGGKAVTYEETVTMKEGEFTTLTVKFPIYDENGKLTGICGIATDITEQRRSEAERAVLQEKMIEAQRATLDELSTPLIPLAKGVLAMPVVGIIDSLRADQILETLLEGVIKHRAHTAILDITGVRVVDVQVASGLVSAARAARLLGARVLLTGIRPEVAQMLVGLDTDLAGVVTLGTLESGIAYALGR